MRQSAHVIALLSLIALWGAPAPAGAQLRYVATLDLSEQYNSNILAGTRNLATGELDIEWDLVTIIEPGLRFYLSWPRNLLYARYAFLFQVHNRARDLGDFNDPNDDSVLLGYGNRLDLGYNRRLSRRSELALVNRLRQGTENAALPGHVDASGTPTFGRLTTGTKYVSDALQLGYHRELSERWGLAVRVVGEVNAPYDRAEIELLVPPPLAAAFTVSNRVFRTFSIGTLSLAAEYTFLSEYRDQGMEQFRDRMPEWADTMVGAALVRWRHQLSEMWVYQLGGGIDVRAREEFETSEPHPSEFVIINNGYGEPALGPVAEASLRFRWQRFLAATLYYGHRYQYLLENQVSSTANVDEVGLDVYLIVDPWRFDLFGSFRNFNNESRFEGAANQEDTMQGRLRASVIYLLRPGVSLELAYALEATSGQVVVGRSDINARPEPTVLPDYRQHRVTVGVSLAWPPPPPQDVRLNRRESDYEPLFLSDDGVGANDLQQRPGGLEEGERPGAEDPRCASPEARQENRDLCVDPEAEQRDTSADQSPDLEP